jgi:hypothetical protein
METLVENPETLVLRLVVLHISRQILLHHFVMQIRNWMYTLGRITCALTPPPQATGHMRQRATKYDARAPFRHKSAFLLNFARGNPTRSLLLDWG